MLKPLAKNSKKKVVDDPFEKGMSLLRGKQYKKAIVPLSQALQSDPKGKTRDFYKKFNEYYSSGSYQAALAIGHVLSDVLKADPTFANKLGNCQRRLGSFKKANDCYRKAIRLDKSHPFAMLNLAASLAKVDLYDEEIKNALAVFGESVTFVLPEYLNDPGIVAKLEEELEKERKVRSNVLQELIEEKREKSIDGETEEVKNIIHKIEMEERKNSSQNEYEFICKKLRRAIKTNWSKQSIEESKARLQENLFNLGLFAFSRGDQKLASECFGKLESEKSEIDNLDLMRALTTDMNGDHQDAVGIIIASLTQKPDDRLLNVNLGLIYKKIGNSLLSQRYLLKAASLLEESEGLYEAKAILRRADEYFENDQFDRALQLYKIVNSEQPNPGTWFKIGIIMMNQDNLVEAIMAFHEVLESDPSSFAAKQKLTEIHDLYCLKAESSLQEGGLLQAAVLFENALEQHRSIETLKRLLKVYQKLEENERAEQIKQEIETLKQERHDNRQENKRLQLIERGKALMKHREFKKAIDQLEEAFEIKPDKDVFLLLAYLFKSLKLNQKLANLMRQFRILNEREERLENSAKPTP